MEKRFSNDIYWKFACNESVYMLTRYSKLQCGLIFGFYKCRACRGFM